MPGSSANLGPGFDVLAAAVDRYLDLRVEPAQAYELDIRGAAIRSGRDNFCVSAFESLHPVEEVRFEIRLGLASGKGLGASAAAIVAGLVAANEMAGLGLSDGEIYRRAVEIEGHPDNVAASLFGGGVVCGVDDDGSHRLPARFELPTDLRALIVQPEESLSTITAREALPDQVEMADAVANISGACRLLLALQTNDFDLLRSSLGDRLHQPHRANLYPRSYELLSRAASLGAIGATISGAGPCVLVWTRAEQMDEVLERFRTECAGWAQVEPTQFTNIGAVALADPESHQTS